MKVSRACAWARRENCLFLLVWATARGPWDQFQPTLTFVCNSVFQRKILTARLLYTLAIFFLCIRFLSFFQFFFPLHSFFSFLFSSFPISQFHTNCQCSTSSWSTLKEFQETNSDLYAHTNLACIANKDNSTFHPTTT